MGSGLVIQPVGQEVLAQVGALEAAAAQGAWVTHMLGREVTHGRRVLDVSYGREAGLAIHRATLFQALFQAMQRRDVTLCTGAQVTHAEAGILHLTQGQLGPFDLIVDASGAGSVLSPLVSRPLPFGAIWGTVDWPDTALPRDQLSQRYRRADRMIGILPIGRLPGDTAFKAALFWSLPRGGHGAWLSRGLAAWHQEAQALWPDLAPFLAQITRPDQMTLAEYSHGTLSRPHGPGIVHIGDAAHRASPQLGQGANMALLDATALAAALDRHPYDLSDALRAYTFARRWHVRIYQGMSAAFTPQYQSNSRWLPVLRDRALFPLSQIPPIPKILTALVTGRMLPPLGSLTK